jgi:hypothetical protein
MRPVWGRINRPGDHSIDIAPEAGDEFRKLLTAVPTTRLRLFIPLADATAVPMTSKNLTVPSMPTKGLS